MTTPINSGVSPQDTGVLFTHPADYDRRNVIPLRPLSTARAMNDRAMIKAYQRIEYRSSVARKQRWIGLLCMGLSAFVVVYFVGQLFRAVLS